MNTATPQSTQSGGSLIACAKGGGEPIPEGVTLAVCYAVLDLGTQHSDIYGKDQRKVAISWECPEHRISVDRDGQKLDLPRAITKRYTLSLSEKSALRSDLQSWRGKAFTPEELAGFDLRKLIGAGCQLQICHSLKDGKKYADITGIMSLPKGVKGQPLENPPLFFALSALTSPLLPGSIPEWCVKIIMASAEYRAIQDKWAPSSVGSAPRTPGQNTNPATATSATGPVKPQSKPIARTEPAPAAGDGDDDVPF